MKKIILFIKRFKFSFLWLKEIILFIRRLKVSFWWYFIVKQDKEHHSINNISFYGEIEKTKFQIRKKIAEKIENEELEIFSIKESILKKAGF